MHRPDLFKAPKNQELAIVTDGYYQGTLIQQPGGRKVNVVYEIDNMDVFHDYVLEQLASR